MVRFVIRVYTTYNEKVLNRDVNKKKMIKSNCSEMPDLFRAKPWLDNFEWVLPKATEEYLEEYS